MSFKCRSFNIVGIRYYVEKVSGDIHRVIQQEKFLSKLRGHGVDITLGRVERRTLDSGRNPMIVQLKELFTANRTETYISRLSEKIIRKS